MAIQLSAADARESLTAHVAAKGAAIRGKYGPRIGWKELRQILDDRTCVRYPCEIVFDAGPLNPGEFAHPIPRGNRPEDGFKMHVHPFFLTSLDQVAMLVLYQLVLVNYGEFVSAEAAEVFGAAALGLSQEDYYRSLCHWADQVAGGDLA